MSQDEIDQIASRKFLELSAGVKKLDALRDELRDTAESLRKIHEVLEGHFIEGDPTNGIALDESNIRNNCQALLPNASYLSVEEVRELATDLALTTARVKKLREELRRKGHDLNQICGQD